MTSADDGRLEEAAVLDELPRRGSHRTMRIMRQWFPLTSGERTIKVQLAVNSHYEERVYTVDDREATFVKMRPIGNDDAFAKEPFEVFTHDVDEWWGTVAAIDREAETFVAELYQNGREHTDVNFSTTFRLTQVAPGERDRLAEGAVFVWRSIVNSESGASRSWIELPTPEYASKAQLEEEERAADEWLRQREVDGSAGT